MKITFVPFLTFLSFCLWFTSCELGKKADVPINTSGCEGFSRKPGGDFYDSIHLPPYEYYYFDSIENGYRVFTRKLASEKDACFNDSILVSITVCLNENQPKPILVRSYIEVVYFDATTNHVAHYNESIPLINNRELWEPTMYQGFSQWPFVPKPHVAGADWGYFYIHLDLLVPATTDYTQDSRYLDKMTEYITMRYMYYGSDVK